MGNQISNENDGNRSTDDVASRRKQSIEPVSPHFNNSFILVEKPQKVSVSPKPSSRRRISSPGLEILATELKRGKTTKKISSREITAINRSLKFVGVLHYIKQERRTAIHLNEGPLLGINSKVICKERSLSQEIMADRMSFSLDKSEEFARRYKSRANAYFEAMDRVGRALFLQKKKEHKTHIRKANSLNKGIIKKQLTPSFEFNPSNHEDLNTEPFSSILNSNNINNTNHQEPTEHDLFKNIVFNALDKENKTNTSQVSQASRFEETKTMREIAPKSKRLSEASSILIRKNGSMHKSPLELGTDSTIKKNTLHSRSEVPVRKTPKSSRVDIVNLPDTLATERNHYTQMNTVETRRAAYSKSPIRSNFDSFVIHSDKKKVMTDLDYSTLHTDHTTGTKIKEEVSMTDITIDSKPEKNTKKQKEALTDRGFEKLGKSEVVPSQNKKQPATRMNTQPNSSHHDKNVVVQKNQKKTENSSQTKKVELFTLKSAKTDTQAKIIQSKPTTTNPTTKKPVTSVKAPLDLKKKQNANNHPSNFDENVSPNIGLSNKESNQNTKGNQQAVEVVLDLTKYAVPSKTQEDQKTSHKNKVKVGILKEKEIFAPGQKFEQTLANVCLEPIEIKGIKETSNPASKLNTRTNSAWATTRTQSHLSSVRNTNDGLPVKLKEKQGGRNNERAGIVLGNIMADHLERDDLEKENYIEEDMKETNIVDEIREKLEKLSVLVENATEKFKVPVVQDNNSLLSAQEGSQEKDFIDSSQKDKKKGIFQVNEDSNQNFSYTMSPTRVERAIEKDRTIFARKINDRSPSLVYVQDKEIFNKTNPIYFDEDDELEVRESRDEVRINPTKIFTVKHCLTDFGAE